ncbi:MAG: glycosyltransferase family 1 protein, partial [SAR324 cluster bacterium]|nr:glycosyltransferase family 1 protein [SAR324 cluster bacterium]
GETFCRVVRYSKINIGLIRRANRDGHSMRSYEIAACGGGGLYEDTPEHRELFEELPDYSFFSSPEDLSQKCSWLLEHPKEREEMRLLGIRNVVRKTNTYSARLKTIFEYCDEKIKLI